MVQFGYWKIRGLAGPIRLLCKYTGEPLAEDFYEPPRENWLNVKETLKLDFPNLPYMIDGDVRLTQSNAILRYIARKHSLLGKDEQQMAIVDMVIEEAMDYNKRFTGMCYSKEFESLLPDYLEKLPYFLKRTEAFLEGKTWFAGDSITACDFLMWHQIEQITLLEPKCLDEFPLLKGFLQRFESLPELEAYMKSDEFLHWPINGFSAKFGGSGPDPKK